MLSLIFTVAVFAALAWFAYHFVSKFRESEGSIWERTLAGAKDSATVLWGGVLYVAGVLLYLAEKASTFLNMPEVTSFIQNQLPSQWGAIGLMVVGVVTIIARLRTLFD